MKLNSLYKNKKIQLILFSITIILSSFIIYKKFHKKKYNILIISYCSFRADLLEVYSKKPTKMPILNNFAKNSIVFDNFISNFSWTNLTAYLLFLNEEFLKKTGYKVFGNKVGALFEEYIVKNKITPVANYYQAINPLQAEFMNYNLTLAQIKKNMKNESNWPFIHFIHSKLLHTPYNRTFNIEELTTVKRLSSKEIKYVEDAYNGLSKSLDRLPFILVLFNRSDKFKYDILKILPLTNKQKENVIYHNSAFIGLITDKYLLEKWKKSKYFKSDLEIIRKVYSILASQVDKALANLINLFNDQKLQENTIIIFVSDHGESFFEKEDFFHGDGVSEELIKLVGLIKIPGQNGITRINKQLFVGGMPEIIKLIMEGDFTLENFEQKINDITEKFKKVYSSNCVSTKESLRIENNWKIVRDFTNDQVKLFKLGPLNYEEKEVDTNPEIIEQYLGDLELVKNNQAKYSKEVYCH